MPRLSFLNESIFGSRSHRTAGFTLIQVIVVLGIICALAALLFPVLGRVREDGRQATCSSNLKQIYIAVRQYYQDETRYPPNISPLLPFNTIIVAAGSQPQRTETGADLPMGFGEMGYLRSLDVLLCPNDTNEYNIPHSSYDTVGDPLVSVWNYRGYNEVGQGYGEYLIPQEVLAKPHEPYDLQYNPVRLSLSNRFAPPRTIVSHCRFHRSVTTGVQNPDDIYDPAFASGNPARDLILRLDGTVKSVDVSQFSGVEPDTKWQSQDF